MPDFRRILRSPARLSQYALMAITSLCLLGYLTSCWDFITYPFSLEYGEGHIAYLSRILKHTHDLRALYPPFSQAPYIHTPYPPVFFVLHALGLELFPDLNPFISGRLISLAALTVTLGATFTFIRRLTGRSLYAWLSLLGFLSSYPFLLWGLLSRVDILALMWTALGITFYLTSSRLTGKCLGMLCLVAALFTKQTFFLAPLLLMTVEFISRRRPKNWYLPGLVFMIFSCGTFLILNQMTGGRFVDHTIAANALHTRHWDLTIYGFLYLLTSAVPLLPLFIWYCALKQKTVALYLRRDPVTAFCLLYPVFSLLVSAVYMGKAGSSTNHSIETTFASLLSLSLLSRLSGIHLSSALPRIPLIPRKHYRLLAFGLMTVCMVYLYLGSQITLSHHFTTMQQDLPAYRLLLDRIESSHGPFLSDDPSWAPLTEKTEYLMDPFGLMQLIEHGLFDPSPILFRLQDKTIKLILLSDSCQTENSQARPDAGRMNEGLCQAITSNYHKEASTSDDSWPQHLWIPD